MINNLDKLLIVSADFAHAPIELRERLAFGASEPHPAAILAQAPGILEALWLETCDRVEAILLVASEETALEQLAHVWWARSAVEMQEHWDHCLMYRGAGAVRHLVRILSGVDVAFPGSLHLRFDFHEAWRTSWESGGMKGGLDEICREVCRLAKRLASDVADGVTETLPAPYCPPPNAASVQATAAAIRIIGGHFGELAGRRALLIGAGRLGGAMARALAATGLELTIADRYAPAARDLAASLGARWITLNAQQETCCASDLVISAARARKHVCAPADLARLGREAFRPRLLLDFSFPRAIDPDLQQWGASLYHVDQIARRASTSALERDQARRRGKVDDAVACALRWPEEIPEPLTLRPGATGHRPSTIAGAA